MQERDVPGGIDLLPFVSFLKREGDGLIAASRQRLAEVTDILNDSHNLCICSEKLADTVQYTQRRSDIRTIRLKEMSCTPADVHVYHDGVDGIRAIAASGFSKPWEVYGASLLGPVLAFYVDWVISRMEESAIHVLMVSCAESNVLAELFKHAIAAKGLAIEVVDFETTAEFTFLASIDRLSRADIVSGLSAKTIGDLFDLFDIPRHSSELSSIIDHGTENPHVLQSVAAFFLKDNVRDYIENKCKANRDLLMQHLTPLFFSQKKVAIAGVSNFLEIQRHIEKMLRICNVQGELAGFYVFDGRSASGPSCIDTSQEAVYLDWVDANMGGDTAGKGNCEKTDRFDTGFRRASGRNQKAVLSALSGQGNPHFADLQNGALHFQLWWNVFGRPYLSSVNSDRRTDSENALLYISRAIIMRLLLSPTESELVDFGALKYSDFQTGNTRCPVLDPRGKLRLLDKGYSAVVGDLRHAWPAGVLGSLGGGLIESLWRAPDDADAVDAILFDDDRLNERLPFESITAKDIVDLHVSVGGWSQYSFAVICPVCHEVFNCNIAGTLIVSKPVLCPGCQRIFLLSYDAISVFVATKYKHLFSNDIVQVKDKLSKLTDRVNHTTMTSETVPLLAALANEYFIALINGITLKHFVSFREEDSNRLKEGTREGTGK